ncbi:TPM domain-containing protein [Mesorhizobium sp. M1E.F.Ca.ET.045.02.1.1]|uniref:TPM domain-containing protein n=1 Tax=unclassified Mesorhizobium TaxID=325217 RepID=UPI000F754285|nr:MULTISPECIES: TPM domain-containing protein [unclassified Mesorhizobium]AZO21072.1 TPM domain-containing protein [Mesorhizobium sp. M1E.F.Ca.ET.045.02.1.1]RUW85152.1 TPM domain-containing protein [Mesorhizobium sp. M1E.F.Ca.ET.063.01.1.1]RWB53296.1 MAG: TPM domain-containing protein [Mesorhizobium sp.]TKB08965.1 MAG: TPM domain-containing protein [Mesorhizobium sp.]
MATRPISPEDHDRIAGAIRAAEARTDGEIYCVVAQTSDGYFFPAAFAAAIATLIVSLAVAYGLEAWWLTIRLPHFVLAQLLSLGCMLALLWALPGWRIHLVPRRLRYQAAHANAMKQFLARNVHRTSARTGVLIFVSIAERYAEIVADSGIDAKVGQHVWDGVVRDLTRHAGDDRLADGFVKAIESVGAVLAEHFPVTAGDANELDDHLVEI